MPRGRWLSPSSPRLTLTGRTKIARTRAFWAALGYVPLAADALPACCSDQDLLGSPCVCLHPGDSTPLWFALNRLLHCDVTLAAGSRHSSFSTRTLYICFGLLLPTQLPLQTCLGTTYKVNKQQQTARRKCGDCVAGWGHITVGGDSQEAGRV